MTDPEDGSTLRPYRAGPADAPRLAALARAAYGPLIAVVGREPEPYGADYAALLQDHEAWMVPAEDGSLAGAIVLRWARDHVLVWSVAVAPGRQHQGLGRHFMGFVETVARARGLAEVRLYTNLLMTRNRRIYARLGYEETGRDRQGERVRVNMAKALGAPIEFWFELASPYAYIAAERIGPLAAAAGVAIRWQPLLLGALFKRRPGNASGFQEAPPDERRYRWRDAERLCARYGLALRTPSTYPRPSLLAARVALVGQAEGWCRSFALACYRANFTQDRDIADPAVIGDVLAGLGLDAAATLAAAQHPDNKVALAATVERALSLGIFGAPSFRVGDELFWGQDRLEQAFDWATKPETRRP